MGAFVDRWHVLLGVRGLGIGVVVLLVCGQAARRFWWSFDATLVAVACAVASMVAFASLSAGWLAVILLLPLAVRFDQAPVGLGPMARLGSGIAWSSLIGVWATVPDTEPALLAVCVVAPAVAGSLLDRRPNAAPAITALTLLSVVAALGGSAGRWPAVLGALCCLAVPSVSLGMAWLRADGSAGLRRAIAVEHLLAMTIGSRVVAHRPAGTAVALTIVVVGGIMFTMGTVALWSGRKSD